MLTDAVSHYHELLADAALAEESRRTLDAGLEDAKLIFGGRRLSPYLRPHFVLASDWSRVTRICETLWGAIGKVKDAALADDAVLDYLGIHGIERDLVSIDPGYAEVSPSARLDSFLADDVYSYVELNGESPAGIAYADAAYDIFRTLPVMQRFEQRYTVRAQHGSEHMLAVLRRCYAEYLGRTPERDPRIAIVDLSDRPTVKEFELFRDFFKSRGVEAVICTPEELEFSAGKLRAGDFEIDVVYKRLLVNEYLPVMDSAPALVDAYRAGAVCMVNSFRAKLVHKKTLFALLTDASFAHLFAQEERAVIDAHVPWTRRFREGRTDRDGAQIDLLDYVRRNRDQLVLKPSDDYGGSGIWIGWNSDAGAWDDAMNQALADGDYLIQQRVRTAREVFPALASDGAIEYTEQLVDLDPLLFDGRVRSAFTRLSSTELANVSSGGGMVPTFIIENE